MQDALGGKSEGTYQGVNHLYDSDSDSSVHTPRIVTAIRENLSVYWTIDDTIYYGMISSAEENGHLNVHYEEEKNEFLYMIKENCKFNSTAKVVLLVPYIN